QLGQVGWQSVTVSWLTDKSCTPSPPGRGVGGEGVQLLSVNQETVTDCQPTCPNCQAVYFT
ncbi:MAG: hypothetical protein EBV05_01960, partial [Cyanobacteria bacterium WB6_1B_304]|nr:hypothetical protein [Cyanobacteria bacterium WB6_1B_304]